MNDSDIMVSDIILAATLAALNFPIKSLNGPYDLSGKPVYKFAFAKDDSIQSLISQYQNDKLLIEPKRFIYYYRDLKGKIFHARDGQGGQSNANII